MATPQIVERQLAEAEQLAQAQQQALAQANQAVEVVTDASQLQQPRPAQPQPAAEPPKPQIDWEQKFKSLQGMYNAEVPALRTQAKTQESQLMALSEQVRVLTATAKAVAEAKPKERPVADPKDVESFGADMIDMVQRYIQQAHAQLGVEFQNLAGQFEARVKALEDQLAGVRQTSEQSLEQGFYATLARLVPDWKQINEDERWLAWLAEVDPVYGAPRQDALANAHRRMDADRTAAVFNAFKAGQPTKPTLASQQSPQGGAAYEPPSAPASRPMISSKFVNTFFSDVAKGRYAGRQEEAQRIEQEINLAAAEGRIV